MTIPLEKETHFTRRRYNRIAPVYDLMEGLVEKGKYARWRKNLWSRVRGPKVLEIGVGTGKNFEHHPANIDIVGVDLSEEMLARARQRAQHLQARIQLLQMDAQRLDFADETFDEVVATFVFCSVPDPVLGLSEALRVTKPGGRLLLLEHMLADQPLLARIMTCLDRPVHWITGVHIARRTVDNVVAAGWEIDSVAPLSFGAIFREIVAYKP
ncbi:MAG: methyltransferase domain-containing protein [Chloroflexi bacterium]|nr:methyltransferase domain-containing protein [Chloroflexota bacterium]